MRRACTGRRHIIQRSFSLAIVFLAMFLIVKIVFAAPLISSVILNATDNPINSTDANLTAWPQGKTDVSDIIYDWRLDGTSIAVLNMNFDVDESAGAGKTKDYSTYGNDATEYGSIVWGASSGWNDSGAYTFDGIDDYLQTDGDEMLDTEWNGTLVLWVKLNEPSATQNIFSTEEARDRDIWIEGDEFHTAMYDGSNRELNGSTTTSGWHHVAFMWNLLIGDYYLYVDGSLVDSLDVAGSTTGSASNPTVYGKNYTAQTGGIPNRDWLNGSIDEVKVFDRVLSAAQVLALYNNRSDILVSDETTVGENWSVCATPNNGTEGGSEVCSNSVRILGPYISSVILNSTNVSSNSTNTNLTAWSQGISSETDDIIYDWRESGTSIAYVNMNFDVNDSAGTDDTKDYSIFGNDGDVIVDAEWNATGGWNGTGAYHFDGSGGHILIPHDVSQNSSGYITTSVWIFIDEHKDHQRIMGKYFYVGAGSKGPWRIQMDENKNISFSIQVGTSSYYRRSTSGLSNQTWYHIVGTFDGVNHNLYINGILNASAAVSGVLNESVTYPIAIATTVNNTNATQNLFKGYIDNVLILDRGISAEQVKALYENNTWTLVNNETTVGDNWSVCATPNDGTVDGNEICSNEVQIQADIPSITSIILNATNHPVNNTNANLTANPQGVLNTDNILYDWRKENSSIAFVNYNFDVDESGGSGLTKDYSSYGNDATEYGSIAWSATAGWNSTGAYVFDGIDDYLGTDGDEFLANGMNGTIMMWVKPNEPSATQNIFTTMESRDRDIWIGGGSFNASIWDGGTRRILGGGTVTSDWQHITYTWNLGMGDYYLYINGTLVDSIDAGSATGAGTENPTVYGMNRGSESGGVPARDWFNGTMDNVMAFNNTLSVAQIKAIYENKTYLIVSEETSVGDNWSVCATPNDGLVDGNEVCSNDIIINTIPILTSIILNSTSGRTSASTDNLTAWESGNYYDDIVWDWRKNDTSFAEVIMNFDVINSAGVNSTLDYTLNAYNASALSAAQSPVFQSSGGVRDSGYYVFDGNPTSGQNDHFQFDETDIFDGLDEGTIMMWVKWTGAGFESIFDADSGNCINPFEIAMDGGNFRIWASTGGCSADINGGITVSSPTQWNHLAYRSNSTHNAFFLNGQRTTASYSVGSSTTPFFFSNASSSTTHYVIGSTYLYSPEAFTGSIDDFRIYGVPLSDEQIYEIYANNSAFIDEDHLFDGDNWTACATPNNGVEDGDTVCSNKLIIGGDTCFYGGAHDWYIDGADTCVLTSNNDLSSNDIIVTGTGSLNIQGNISNFANFIVSETVDVIVNSGGRLG